MSTDTRDVVRPETAERSAAWLLAELVLHMDMVTPKGVRARELARQVLASDGAPHEGECADVLRDLASYLGAGGYNAPAVDPAVFKDKIMWGIEQLRSAPPPPERAAPDEAIGKMLAAAMDQAVKNGANSVSMPDEYVEIAAWLAQHAAARKS